MWYGIWNWWHTLLKTEYTNLPKKIWNVEFGSIVCQSVQLCASRELLVNREILTNKYNKPG